MSQENKKIKDKKLLSLVGAIFALGFFVFWTYVFYIPQKIQKATLEEKKAYPFLNPARKTINKNDLIINIQPLRDNLNQNFGNNPNVSVYFEFLNTGASVSINKDANFYPASLIKVPLALAVAKKIEKGDWRWTNELVIMDQDRDENFGVLYKKPVGTKITIEELVREMIVNSDNTAYMILLRNIEPGEFDDVKEHLGLGKFFNEEGFLSAKNYSVILRSLYNSSYLSDEISQKILTMMSQTSFKEYINSALPNNVVFSHKIGISEKENVILDSGIIYIPDRPYILTIMTKGLNKEGAVAEMKGISQEVYNYISQYQND